MNTKVTRNDAASRYELLVDGEIVGVADYVERDGAVEMPHTVVDPARRGQGLAEVLVRGALDDLRVRGDRVLPTCWYVAAFIDRDPSYADLLAG